MPTLKQVIEDLGGTKEDLFNFTYPLNALTNKDDLENRFIREYKNYSIAQTTSLDFQDALDKYWNKYIVEFNEAVLAYSEVESRAGTTTTTSDFLQPDTLGGRVNENNKIVNSVGGDQLSAAEHIINYRDQEDEFILRLEFLFDTYLTESDIELISVGGGSGGGGLTTEEVIGIVESITYTKSEVDSKDNVIETNSDAADAVHDSRLDALEASLGDGGDIDARVDDLEARVDTQDILNTALANTDTGLQSQITDNDSDIEELRDAVQVLRSGSLGTLDSAIYEMQPGGVPIGTTSDTKLSFDDTLLDPEQTSFVFDDATDTFSFAREGLVAVTVQGDVTRDQNGDANIFLRLREANSAGVPVVDGDILTEGTFYIDNSVTRIRDVRTSKFNVEDTDTSKFWIIEVETDKLITVNELRLLMDINIEGNFNTKDVNIGDVINELPPFTTAINQSELNAVFNSKDADKETRVTRVENLFGTGYSSPETPPQPGGTYEEDINGNVSFNEDFGLLGNPNQVKGLDSGNNEFWGINVYDNVVPIANISKTLPSEIGWELRAAADGGAYLECIIADNYDVSVNATSTYPGSSSFQPTIYVELGITRSNSKENITVNRSLFFNVGEQIKIGSEKNIAFGTFVGDLSANINIKRTVTRTLPDIPGEPAVNNNFFSGIGMTHNFESQNQAQAFIDQRLADNGETWVVDSIDVESFGTRNKTDDLIGIIPDNAFPNGTTFNTDLSQYGALMLIFNNGVIHYIQTEVNFFGLDTGTLTRQVDEEYSSLSFRVDLDIFFDTGQVTVTPSSGTFNRGGSSTRVATAGRTIQLYGLRKQYKVKRVA